MSLEANCNIFPKTLQRCRAEGIAVDAENENSKTRSNLQYSCVFDNLKKGEHVAARRIHPLTEITNIRIHENRLKTNEESFCKRPVTSRTQSLKNSERNGSEGGISELTSAKRGISSIQIVTANPVSGSKAFHQKPWTPSLMGRSGRKSMLKTGPPACRMRYSLNKTKEASNLQVENCKAHEKAHIPSPDSFTFEDASQEAPKLTELQMQILEKVQKKPIRKLKKECQTENEVTDRMVRRLSQVVRSEEELLKKNKQYVHQLHELQQLFSDKDSEVESFRVVGVMLKDLYNKQVDELKALKATYATTFMEITRYRELCGRQEEGLRELKSAIPSLKEQVNYLKSQLRTLELELAKEKSEKLLLKGIVNQTEQANAKPTQHMTVGSSELCELKILQDFKAPVVSRAASNEREQNKRFASFSNG